MFGIVDNLFLFFDCKCLYTVKTMFKHIRGEDRLCLENSTVYIRENADSILSLNEIMGCLFQPGRSVCMGPGIHRID